MLVRVAIADDGSRLAVVDESGTVTLLTAGGHAERELVANEAASDGVSMSIAFDTRGRLVVLASDGKLRIFEPSTGALESEVTAHIGPAAMIADVSQGSS